MSLQPINDQHDFPTGQSYLMLLSVAELGNQSCFLEAKHQKNVQGRVGQSGHSRQGRVVSLLLLLLLVVSHCGAIQTPQTLLSTPQSMNFCKSTTDPTAHGGAQRHEDVLRH